MKFKTTKRAIKEGYHKIISVSYCSLQYLLKGINPVAYSTRSEGWACDYYDVDGICICEGYSPISSQNTKELSYDKIREYDQKAKDIAYNMGSGSWYDIEPKLKDLLNEFVQECTS